MTTTLPDQEFEPGSLGALLNDQKQKNPGAALLVLKKGLSLAPGIEAAMHSLLKQIEAEAEGPVVLTVLSNAVSDLNPYSGLATATEDAPSGPFAEQLVTLLAPGEILEWQGWPEHCLLISAPAVEALARSGTTSENALFRLHQAGGNVLLADSIFAYDPELGLFRQDVLEPHEQRRPAAWGVLSERLDSWLKLPRVSENSSWQGALDDFHAGERPVTLHLTHSWGGGVAQFVESFIQADESGLNFQLRSEGPQTGKGCGQRLALYLDNQLESSVASWWLQPPIQSTAEEHSQYRKILREISQRYGVGRIIVSSLVGHSLEALATEIPTIQVLHDFYPLWPLLGIHPSLYLEKDPADRLQLALQEHTLLPEFRDRDARGWEQIGRRWRENVGHWAVQVVAPSRSVADLLRRLDPAWSEINIEILPHGLPELAGSAEVLPKDREDGRLRLVVPGRILQGKGRDLLMTALPQVTELAQVYLLGCGKEGEAFFGKSGVDVILQYHRDDLRELLQKIGPHVAGLLSIVPETFSYTLSEMQQLNIPVIANRVGSLEERITDGETGWLIEPDPEALVARLATLAEERSKISEVRERLKDFDLPGAGQMVRKYEKICLPRPARRAVARTQNLDTAQVAALAFEKATLTGRNRVLKQQNESLQMEVEKRSRWAEERERERKEEVKRRKTWVSSLEDQLRGKALEFEHEQSAHRQTNLHLEQLRAVHDWVLASASWRLTRPFRVLARIFKNLAQARAWNPLRWRLIYSQSVRTLGTQGLKGALVRAQLSQTKTAIPETQSPEAIPSVGDPEPPGRFPREENPEVSIVIPVYNQWIYTAACLRSLAESTNAASFEVIVVDDQSSDESSTRLADIDGLIYLRNEQNLGFIGSCNRGAGQARGQYIVLLNNDTQVSEGWLDALLKTFQQHPDTGIVGARLIYPDGTLQEAGGIIFRDGSGWNYGKGDEANRPDYLFLREVDYCSGACILMNTELFRELGGLDGHYAPAYYEDTDLAFQVRSKGLKVYVQPAVSIVHHEGVSSGTDLNSGAKRFQKVNREKFLAKWQQELTTYPEPISDPTDEGQIRAARDHRLKGRVLVIDAYTPEPDQDSGSGRLCHLMNCLIELGYGVTFMADNRAYAGKYTVALQQSGIEVVFEPWIDSLQQLFSERGGDFDFIMISRHYVASNYLSLLKRYCPDAKFIFDTVDLHYLREERLAELENSLPLQRSAAQTRRSELAVIDAADATIVVSPVEKSVLEKAAPEAPVHVISNVHEVSESQRTFKQRKDIFFVGGYQHPPNIDAAHWFVTSIWPLIHEQLPDMVFHLIGSKAPERVRALHGNGVRFHGFVKSLDPWLDGCRLAVAPLRYGAGIKGKVNLSMSRGQPVVATPMAVEGMFAESGRDVLIAESAEEFADAIIKLYQDEELWNRISIAGLENVRQYFSVETARLGLQQLLRSI
jgi:GT2 family glycosyltransferase/glycosyltransferase involved in cell wall biosynthesis